MIGGKTVVLGVTGSVAAYKAAEIASRLTQLGASVHVVLTDEATEFVSAVTFRAVTGRPVVTRMFDLASEFSIEHVSLAQAADVLLIAPATANTIAKLAVGMADDMLSCTVLATKAPVIVAPAMEPNMYENPATQSSLAMLRARGFLAVGPAWGRVASGREGPGRLSDVGEIVTAVCKVLQGGDDLTGRRIVVTAGGTQEPLDPVRYVTNRSSGKMGYALAEAASARGASVLLITAPSSLARPVGIDVVDVTTAQEMYEAVGRGVRNSDALIMAAAVADYRPATVAGEKMKKTGGGLTLELEPTPDILRSVKGNFLKVGFAAESSNLTENARKKVREKGLDLIVANDVTASDSGFGVDTNRVTIIDREGTTEDLPLLTKREVADRILDRVLGLLAGSVRKEDAVSIVVRSAYLKQRYLRVPVGQRKRFPGFKVPFRVETCKGVFQAYVTDTHPSRWEPGSANTEALIRGLGAWFRAHPQIKAGDTLVIECVEPMKLYRLRRLDVA